MDVFLAALDVPASERRGFVAQRCGDNGALRDRVEALLRRAAEDDAPDPVAPAARQDGSTAAGVVLGDYVLQRELGHGAMGVVWLAEQKSLERLVALKLVRPSLASPDLLRRLEREAAILGRLQHPGIANVYSVGSVPLDAGGIGGSQHFFAMEYVQGEALDVYAERHGLDLAARLELVARICDAVEHAHQRGVIHRDLKPDNILVTQDGTPKVLDFGIARATSSDVMAMTMQTAVGQLVGTVPYMSPEQVLGDPTRIDARSDVYALGVLLYQLLGGRLPNDVRGISIPEAARMIRDDEPTRLGSVATSCRGDVETIVHKALEKDPARRYGSAGALAADLRRHLRNEPIVARPTTTFYQLRKFASRHKGFVVGLATTFVALVAGVVVSSWFAVAATHSAAAFEREAYSHGLMVAASALRENDVVLAEAALRGASLRLRGWEWRHLDSRVDMSLCALPLPRGATTVVGTPWFSDDNRALSVWVGYLEPKAGREAHVTLERWRLPDGERLESGASMPIDEGGVKSMDMYAQPGWGRIEGPWLEWFRPESTEPLRIVWAEFAEPDRLSGNFWFTPSGSHAAWSSAPAGGSLSDNIVWLAEIRDGHVVDPRRVRQGIPRWLSADGSQMILETDADGGVMLWSEGRGSVPLEGHTRELNIASANADGSLLLTAANDGTVRTWNGRTGAPVAVSPRTGAQITTGLLDERGELCVSSTAEGLMHVWDAPGLALRTSLRGHRQKRPGSLALSRDGTLAASVAYQTNEFVRVWDTTVEDDPWALRGHTSYVYALDVSPDGRRIASGGWDDTVRLWDASTLRPTAALTGHRDWVGAVAFSPDGKRLASVGVLKRLKIWDVGSATLLTELSGYAFPECLPITWHPDGARILVGVDGQTLRIFDIGTGLVAAAPWSSLREFRSGLVSPDGSRCVLIDEREDPIVQLRLCTTDTGAELGRVRVDGTAYKFAFSSPGAGSPRLLVAFSDNANRLGAEHSGWCLLDARTGRRLAERVVGRSRTLAVAFSPDGRRFVTGGYDMSISVWDAEHHDELVRLSGHRDYVFRLAYGPDGERLYSASGDGTVRVWGTEPLREVLLARRRQ